MSKSRKTIECGQEAAVHFALEQGYTNLNHGSYGTYPLSVRKMLRDIQERTEAKPDVFVRYEYRTNLLNESRKAIEEYLGVPKDTCVFVPNATNGVETVLRNLECQEGDLVIGFSTMYEAFSNTLKYLSQTTPLQFRMIDYRLPVSDTFLCDALEEEIKSAQNEGLRTRLVLFDTINALPGVRMPFERLTKICRRYGVMSCIDGAHGIGQIPLDLHSLDPDFFITNCHKWLYVPRGCGLLYVPVRNQHLLRSSLPTSFGFGESFIANFANIGTLDDSSYLCVSAALSWRTSLAWQGRTGEDAIMSYVVHLARTGGEVVAKILGTEVLENEERTLGNCAFTNVRLPLGRPRVNDEAKTSQTNIGAAVMKTMILERNTSVYVFLHADAWWARLSAPVYVTIGEFEVAGKQLREVCQIVQTAHYN